VRGRAAVVAAPGALGIAEIALDREPGQALVRLEGCGVCGSNVPLWDGRPWLEYPREPGDPGHEGWGVVERADGVEPGTRVALLSYRAFADYDLCPADHLVPLPPELDGVPFPGEALGCAFNVFARSGIAPGETVAVVGVGFLGAVVTRLAAEAGARVVGVSRRGFARDVAREQGATDTATLEEAEELAERCDVVVEAAGKQATLDLASRLVRTRGRLVIAGFHQDGPRTVDMQSWNWRGIDVVNAHERDPRTYVAGMRAAVDAAARGVVDVESLITHTFPLDRLGDALDAARERPDGFLKAVVLT
jgi:threonine dehydrogenase-like Zn-dependent dehydrogenase